MPDYRRNSQVDEGKALLHIKKGSARTEFLRAIKRGGPRNNCDSCALKRGKIRLMFQDGARFGNPLQGDSAKLTGSGEFLASPAFLRLRINPRHGHSLLALGPLTDAAYTLPGSADGWGIAR